MRNRPSMPALVKIPGRVGGWRIFGFVLGSRPLYASSQEFRYGGARIPAGFTTDLVSAPWFARPFMPLRHLAACALYHDYLLRMRPDLSLRTCDARFLVAMKFFGVPQPWRSICYGAVRTNRNRS